MRIHFPSEELPNLAIHTVARAALSHEYLAERERLWQSRVDRAAMRGDQLWNGDVYVIKDFFESDERNIAIRLTTCEYKDIVMRQEWGAARIASTFGVSLSGPDKSFADSTGQITCLPHSTGLDCAPRLSRVTLAITTRS